MSDSIRAALPDAAPSPRARTILLIDEDATARAFLAEQLTADGYVVYLAHNRDRALALLASTRADVVVADVNGQTLGLLDAVRGANGLASRIDPDTPLITLTGRAGELHRIRALERGADDVIAKPVSYPELRARIAAVLRRTAQRPGSRLLRAGPLSIDTRRREVRVGEREVELTGREHELLATLAAEPGRVFTRAELLQGVWGYHTPSRTLDSHACRLRRKLEVPGGPRLVITVWGIGYRLVDPEPSR